MTKKEVSLDARKTIIFYHENGLDYIKIAFKMKIPSLAIGNIVRKWKKTGFVANSSGRGRKRKTTPRVERKIVQKILGNRALSAPKIAAGRSQQFSVSLYSQIIRNRIREQGFKGRIALNKPLISARKKAKRLRWAKDHSGWTWIGNFFENILG